MTTNLAGKRVVVTGGGRGLGRTIASAFVGAGADVLISARTRDELETTGRSLRVAAGPKQVVEWRVIDLEKREAPQDLLSGKWAAPDILINNAGIQGPIGPLWENSEAGWQSTFQIGLFAPVALMRSVIPAMIERGWGRIINISGGGSTGPRPAFSAYAAAKTALVRITETLAVELKGTGVTANAIAPGAMNTKMLQGIRELGSSVAGKKEVEAAERLLDANEPPGEQAARLCLYLSSEASNEVSGRLIAALWDPWQRFEALAAEMAGTDVFTLRRIVPKDRGLEWDDEK